MCQQSPYDKGFPLVLYRYWVVRLAVSCKNNVLAFVFPAATNKHKSNIHSLQIDIRTNQNILNQLNVYCFSTCLNPKHDREATVVGWTGKMSAGNPEIIW